MQRIYLEQRAVTLFNSKKEIYLYFKTKDPNLQEHKKFLFNPTYSFYKNYYLLKERFKNLKGELQFLTSNKKYSKEFINSLSKTKQLSLF